MYWFSFCRGRFLFFPSSPFFILHCFRVYLRQNYLTGGSVFWQLFKGFSDPPLQFFSFFNLLLIAENSATQWLAALSLVLSLQLLGFSFLL